MPEQYDLFTTNAGTAGYRLNYMEVYNWGTFNKRIYRIAPEGNNSLLTGANASGKSTLIDALLTLLVPAKKDRFYNQSSGNERETGQKKLTCLATMATSRLRANRPPRRNNSEIGKRTL